MGRKKTACHSCASIKTLCSKGHPCSRCKRLLLPCSYHHGDETASNWQQCIYEPRLNNFSLDRTRSKIGCVNCRQRKKKCDEQQPCSDCFRLKLECRPRNQVRAQNLHDIKITHMSSLRSNNYSSSRKTPQPSKPSQSQSQSPEQDQELEVNRELNIWAANVADVLHVENGGLPSPPFIDWIALLEYENLSGPSKHTNLADSAANVDLPVPPKDDELGYATFLPATALNNLTGVTLYALRAWSIGERHLLNHFLQSVSRALAVVEDEDNPFLRVIVPMAIENTMVRHALVALSACHLSRVYPAFEKALLHHRTLALQELKHEIPEYDSVEWALATTLLLCLTEICEGRSIKWFLHLHGSKALLATISPKLRSEPPFNILIYIYNHLCCITSVTAENIPPIMGSSSSIFMPQPSKVHPLVGMSSDLYQSLPSINRLATRVHKEAFLETQEADIRSSAQVIELQLQSWAPEDQESPSRHLSEARAAAFATQWALILRLNQITRRLQNNDPHIMKAADNILSALSLIRPGSEIEAHILLPLFMAGVGSMTKANRLTVEYRLSVMETTIGFGNIIVAHRLLDELWTRENEGETLNWEDLMRDKYPGLVLL